MIRSLHDLTPLEVGGGEVRPTGEVLRLKIPSMGRGYANAQVDDYAKLPRSAFPWEPPVRLSLEARASHAEPRGTLGFGFWNDPFSFAVGFTGAVRRLPAGPRAVWFFYTSPPNELQFDPAAAASGWKASSFQTLALPSLLLTPLAAGAAALARLPGVRGPVVRAAKRSVQAHEADLAARLDHWHTYALTWAAETATFEVDGRTALEAPSPPPGPLGFVAWIDNQYAVVSERDGLRFGSVPTEAGQWLEIAGFSLGTL